MVFNDLNYATPNPGEITSESYVDNTKYFALHDNKLDGTYIVLGANPPAWGNCLSDSNGTLSVPFTITVDGDKVVHTLRLRGDAASNVFPIQFSFTLYNGSTILYQNTFTNDAIEWIGYLDTSYFITSYTISITQINKPNFVARLTSIYSPDILKRQTDVGISLSTVTSVAEGLLLSRELPLSIDLSVGGGTISTLVQSTATINIDTMSHVLSGTLLKVDTYKRRTFKSLVVHGTTAGVNTVYFGAGKENLFYNSGLRNPITWTITGLPYVVTSGQYITLTVNDPYAVCKLQNAHVQHMSIGEVYTISFEYSSDTVGLLEYVSTDAMELIESSKFVRGSWTRMTYTFRSLLDQDTDGFLLFTDAETGYIKLRFFKLEHDSYSLWTPAIADNYAVYGTFGITTIPTVTEGNTYDLVANSIAIPLYDTTYIYTDTGGNIDARVSSGALISKLLDRPAALSIGNATSTAVENTITVNNEVSGNLSGSTHMQNSMTRGTYVRFRLSPDISDVNNNMHKDLSIPTAGYATPTLVNIHTRMKDPTRNIYGKVIVNFMNPLIDDNFSVSTSGDAYNTDFMQVLDGIKDSSSKLFMLHNNRLDGAFKLIGSKNKAGWWSNTLSDASGIFTTPVTASANFTARLLKSLTIVSSAKNDVKLVDFTVNVLSNDTTKTYNIIGNDSYECVVCADPLAEVTNIEVIINKINKAYTPASICELTISSIVQYNQEDLISIDLLDELSYKDEIEALGGISANELTVLFSNELKQFYFNNDASIVSKQLKKNRKVVAYLGTEIIPGTIEWYVLGTFWSQSWDVPMQALYAKVLAFDTIGLLNRFNFRNRQVYINYSVGLLIETVLKDARDNYFKDLAWDIEPSLYSMIVPYAWFLDGSHMQALERIAQSCRINIFCARNGRVVASNRSTTIGFYDTWSDSTNILDKAYPTLYTDIPNIINLTLTKVTESTIQVINDSTVFAVDGSLTKAYIATNPILGNEIFTIDADAGIMYSYTKYSWGFDVTFTGIGTIRNIACTATALEIAKAGIITRIDQNSLLLNGAVTMDISHDFFQDISTVNALADAILADSEKDIYDADVNYRGDISITAGDPIKLLDNITPSDKYIVKRNQLYWDGSLTGKAKVNTQ